MTEPFMQYNAGEVTARWHGGEYINIGYVQCVDADGIDGDDFHAYDVINVWDYAKGAPRIPRTLDAFAARVDEWLAKQDEPDA